MKKEEEKKEEEEDRKKEEEHHLQGVARGVAADAQVPLASAPDKLHSRPRVTLQLRVCTREGKPERLLHSAPLHATHAPPGCSRPRPCRARI